MDDSKPLKNQLSRGRWHGAPAGLDLRREARRSALIIAAGRAFGRKGFHNTTLDEIADELGVTKPMLYRYIKNKHEILYECHRMAISMAEEAYDDAIRDFSRPLERIRQYAYSYISSVTSELGTCVALTEYYSLIPVHHELIQKRRRILDIKLRELIVQAIAVGEIAPCNPKLAVFFFMGAINNINRWFTEGGDLDSEDIAKIFTDHIVNSLNPTINHSLLCS